MELKSLNSIRMEIDAIDVQLQELITERARLGKQVAEVKSRQNSPQYFVPEREAQIIQGVLERNDGTLPDDSMAQIFREIISATRSIEHPTRIAVLGPAGTFTQSAVHRFFGHAVDEVFEPTIDEVFHSVEIGRAEFGVVPVENSVGGVVNSTYDRMLDSPLRLCGEVEILVHHTLISSAQSIAEIKTVQAHPQAFVQCRKWLSVYLPKAKQVSVASNTEAAVNTQGDPTAAAIGNEAAAEIYGMNVIHTNIEDQITNTTRFLVIGNIDVDATGNDKTSILISKKNEPGSLVRLLEPFARYGTNMTKIESRPTRQGMWEYVFFIDFEGHATDSSVVKLFEELKAEAPLFKLLGSYPRSTR